jgi:hypothetical protein
MGAVIEWKKSQQAKGNEKKGKKNEHEYQTQTLKRHLHAHLVSLI